MCIINNMVDSLEEIIETGLCTVVEGSEIMAPAALAGNVLESVSNNEMVQTAAKTLQAVPTAFMGVWATFSVARIVADQNWNNFLITDMISQGVYVLALSTPVALQLATKIFPDHKEKLENFQKTYSTAIKVVNIVAAAIALGWFALLAYEGAAVFTSLILLNSASLATSTYSLYKSAQSPVASKAS